MKTVAIFCPCPKSLPKHKVKSLGLISLTEEISKQPSIDSMLWLLVFTLIKTYNEKEQAEQIKVQMYRLRKGAPGNEIEQILCIRR